MNQAGRRAFMIAACAGFLNSAYAEAAAASAHEIDRQARLTLHALYATNPGVREVGQRALGILIFPRIVKAGFVVGGQSGNGVLLQNGPPPSYYNISAASNGLQAGVQSFSYVLFFMNSSGLDYLRRSNGWTIGSGPTVVVADQAMVRSLTSTTVSQDVYAFAFGQKGLMAGLKLEGSKITAIHPAP